MYNEEKYFDTGKILNEALKAEPQFNLPDNFADMMAEKVGRRFAWEQYFREFMIYLGAIFGLLTVPVAIQFALFDASLVVWTEVFISNIPLFIGVFFLFVFILFADRVILKYLFYKKSRSVS